MIKKLELQGSDVLAVNLTVTATKNSIRVAGGKFRVAGVDYTLADTETTLSLPPSDQVSVMAYLACERGSEEAFLMVDEVMRVSGNFDHYEWTLDGPKPLHLLFVANIPPGTETLDEVPVKVYLRLEPKNG